MLLKRIKHGSDLIRATEARGRATLALYVTCNLLNQVLKLPARRREMNVVLRLGIKVEVHSFSSQLGAYLDVFQKRVHGQLVAVVPRPAGAGDR